MVGEPKPDVAVRKARLNASGGGGGICANEGRLNGRMKQIRASPNNAGFNAKRRQPRESGRSLRAERQAAWSQSRRSTFSET